VTADDVVASIRRLGGAATVAASNMMPRVKDISKKDDKTFVIALKDAVWLINRAHGEDPQHTLL